MACVREWAIARMQPCACECDEGFFRGHISDSTPANWGRLLQLETKAISVRQVVVGVGMVSDFLSSDLNRCVCGQLCFYWTGFSFFPVILSSLSFLHPLSELCQHSQRRLTAWPSVFVCMCTLSLEMHMCRVKCFKKVGAMSMWGIAVLVNIYYMCLIEKWGQVMQKGCTTGQWKALSLSPPSTPERWTSAPELSLTTAKNPACKDESAFVFECVLPCGGTCLWICRVSTDRRVKTLLESGRVWVFLW